MKVTTSGGVQQVPAKRQNRGPGNSTGDGFLKAKQVQKEGQHERGAGGFTVSPPGRESIVDPRPLRVGEKTAGLWIAPYIDTQDVYHQPTRVFFVVKPSAWGTPRVN
ncbi:TPA: type IV conjugative transfer system lipoprotein TraV [Enterobacter hormaechei]|nr:type IV conjugative transfer system lipoprotein TraV [Enterobacter hormaechei]